MGIRDYVKNTFKANTNVKGWASWDAVKGNAKVVGRFVDDLKVPDEKIPPVAISFEEAMKKYGMTEADVRKSMNGHLQTAIVCLVFSVGAFVWMFYLLFIGMILSSVVSLSLSALMAAYGFREHFHYFQMKQRRLTCTVNEWVSSFFSSKR